MQDDFDGESPELIVEHATIPGFLRRIPYRFSMEDLTRFGNKVGKAAEAMQIAFVTTTERSLGVIRVFPLPLLRRVYEVMSGTFGWPSCIDEALPGLPSSSASTETLAAMEKLSTLLTGVLGGVQDPHLQGCMGDVLTWIASERARLESGTRS